MGSANALATAVRSSSGSPWKARIKVPGVVAAIVAVLAFMSSRHTSLSPLFVGRMDVRWASMCRDAPYPWNERGNPIIFMEANRGVEAVKLLEEADGVVEVADGLVNNEMGLLANMEIATNLCTKTTEFLHRFSDDAGLKVWPDQGVEKRIGLKIARSTLAAVFRSLAAGPFCEADAEILEKKRRWRSKFILLAKGMRSVSQNAGIPPKEASKFWISDFSMQCARRHRDIATKSGHRKFQITFQKVLDAHNNSVREPEEVPDAQNATVNKSEEGLDAQNNSFGEPEEVPDAQNASVNESEEYPDAQNDSFRLDG